MGLNRIHLDTAMTKAEYDAFVAEHNRPVNWGPGREPKQATVPRGLVEIRPKRPVVDRPSRAKSDD